MIWDCGSQRSFLLGCYRPSRDGSTLPTAATFLFHLDAAVGQVPRSLTSCQSLLVMDWQVDQRRGTETQLLVPQLPFLCSYGKLGPGVGRFLPLMDQRFLRTKPLDPACGRRTRNPGLDTAVHNKERNQRLVSKGLSLLGLNFWSSKPWSNIKKEWMWTKTEGHEETAPGTA